MPGQANLYVILRIPETASFTELKRAYFQRAKECHPDRHQGSPEKEEEFKQLVRAFNVLSDPQQRRAYDKQLEFARDIDELPDQVRDDGYYPHDGESIMDSLADDILEELVVGNHVPYGATLQTLMRDLENTTKFVRFREGKTHYHERNYQAAFHLLRQATTDSPGNIIYHYYMGICSSRLYMHGLARNHLQVCLQLGAARIPPQQLLKVKRALQRMRRPYEGIFSRFFRAFKPPENLKRISTEEAMISEMNRAITTVMRQRARQARSAEQDQRLLDDQERE